MSSVEKIFEIYSDNPDKIETVIGVMSELAEFLEHKSLGDVLTRLRNAADKYNDPPEEGEYCCEDYEPLPLSGSLAKWE